MPHYWQGKHKQLNRGEAVGITYLELYARWFPLSVRNSALPLIQKEKPAV